MLLKYVCRTEWVKDSLLVLLITLLSSGIILLFFSSIILWYLECKKYNNKIENRLCREETVETVKKDTPTPTPIPEPTCIVKDTPIAPTPMIK